MKISNNPDIFKISINKQNLFNLIQNDNQTGSYNFIEENIPEQNDNINNDMNENNSEEINFQKYLDNYLIEDNSNHFVFVGESYENKNINDLIDNEVNNQNKINNSNINNEININKINDKKDLKNFLTDEEIKRTCLINSKTSYALFQNNIGENSCYINVILHFLFSCKIIFDYLVNLYKNPPNKNKKIVEPKFNNKNNKKSKEKVEKEEKEIEDKEELMISLGEILYKYKKALSLKNRVSILSTLDFRKKLSKISNKFLLNSVADPVEFLDFLLEILIKMDENDIRNNFYLKIKEEYFCPICDDKQDFKYNNETFMHTIYIEDIFNYLSKHKIKIENYTNKLFFYSQLNYLNTEKKCDKKHETLKKFICENNPYYLIINCVWIRNPNIEQVLKLFTLLSLKNKLRDLFEISPQKKDNTKELNYYLTHIILYSSSLFHYNIISYNPNIKSFNLYDDTRVCECNSFPEIVEMITANLISQHPTYYFYPVLLIYSQYDLYKDENLVNENKIDKKIYDSILGNCKNYIEKFEKELMKKKKKLAEKNNKKKNDNNINNNNKNDKFEKNNNNEIKQNTMIENNTKEEKNLKNKKNEEDANKKKEIQINNQKDKNNINNKEKETNLILNQQKDINNKTLTKETQKGNKKEIKEENKGKNKEEAKKENKKEIIEEKKEESKEDNNEEIQNKKTEENNIKSPNNKQINNLIDDNKTKNTKNKDEESIKENNDDEILTNNNLNSINSEDKSNDDNIIVIKINKKKKKLADEKEQKDKNSK